MKRPDFFLVGAPKCGTSALNHYLSQHPGVFMAEKELHFFGKDLGIRFAKPMTEEYYLSLFRNAEANQLCGEASVWYLSSKTAPLEIKSFNPHAKILIMLRNPADMMYSLHSENIYNGFEDISSFESALDSEEDRIAGKCFVQDIEVPRSLWYFHNASYGRQVKNYMNVFGKDAVHIMIYERFFSQPALHFKAALDFLEIDGDFVPKFETVNRNKVVHFRWLHRQIKHPPEFPKKVFRKFVPNKATRHRMMSSVYTRNIGKGERPELSGEIRHRIQEQLSSDVGMLEVITGPIPEWSNDI